MLKDLTLAALSETKMQAMFSEALAAVETSMEKDSDLSGERTITMKMKFKPNTRGYVEVDMSCTCNTPNREIRTFASMKEGVLQIDTFSNDATQPDMLELPENVIQMKKAQGGEK